MHACNSPFNFFVKSNQVLEETNHFIACHRKVFSFDRDRFQFWKAKYLYQRLDRYRSISKSDSTPSSAIRDLLHEIFQVLQNLRHFKNRMQ